MSDVTPAPQPEDATVERTDDIDGDGQPDGWLEDRLDTGEPLEFEEEDEE